MTQKFAFRKGFAIHKQNVTVYSQAIHIRRLAATGGIAMRILIEKNLRKLTVLDGETAVFSCRVALGRMPVGAKEAEGDGRTPEGRYFLCLIKENGKYGRSLGLSYPNPEDAQSAFQQGRIDETTLRNICLSHAEHRRPPWGSSMGGEIYIHEGGSHADWTQGCIALEKEDMDHLFPLHSEIESVEIMP